ncbi:MAG: energy transducer TonB [Saprospiraceae bacterium]|nr:energy transducer TonB [Saprospiraceae bacterium]
MKNSICISTLLVLLGMMVSQVLDAQEASLSDPQVLASASLTTGSSRNHADAQTIRLDEGIKTPSFDHLAQYFAEHLEYPELARQNGVEGELKMQLVISPEGSVIEARVLQGLGLGCDEAAQQMALRMPSWTPASNYGVPVKGKAIVVVMFRLI